jgi:adenylate cyclase
MSEDPKQEYFSDGITNDIITGLSKFTDLFVVASNSTFTYKNKPTKVQEVSHELGVRYVLEGGVQKAGDRVRINAQLIDATTGEHLWAERFDRSLDDIFAVQDEITEKIVAAVFVKVDLAVRDQAMRKPTENVEAYDLLLRAREIWHHWGKVNNDEARQLQEKAIEFDPEYARAYVDVAWSLMHDYLYYGGPEESLEHAFEAAKKAVSLDHEDYRSHWTLGYVFLHKRLYDQAMPAYEKALALNPNDADLIALRAEALTHVGRPQDAIEQMKRAMRLNPLSSDLYEWFLGLAYYHAGQYEEAISTLKPLLHLGWYSVSLRLAASYAQLGRLDEAQAQAAEVLKIKPDFSIATFTKTQSYKNPTDLEHYLDGIRKAGLK